MTGFYLQELVKLWWHPFCNNLDCISAQPCTLLVPAYMFHSTLQLQASSRKVQGRSVTWQHQHGFTAMYAPNNKLSNDSDRQCTTYIHIKRSVHTPANSDRSDSSRHRGLRSNFAFS
jgi:hypothetical protein